MGVTLGLVHEELTVLGVQLVWLTQPPPCEYTRVTPWYLHQQSTLPKSATDFWKSRSGNTAVVMHVAADEPLGGHLLSQIMSAALPQLFIHAMGYSGPLADRSGVKHSIAGVFPPVFEAEVKSVNAT